MRFHITQVIKFEKRRKEGSEGEKEGRKKCCILAYYSKTAESKKSKSSQEESIHYLQMNNNISNDLGNLEDDIMTYLKN